MPMHFLPTLYFTLPMILPSPAPEICDELPSAVLSEFGAGGGLDGLMRVHEIDVSQDKRLDYLASNLILSTHEIFRYQCD